MKFDSSLRQHCNMLPSVSPLLNFCFFFFLFFLINLFVVPSHGYSHTFVSPRSSYGPPRSSSFVVSSFPTIPYSDYCNSIVPESIPTSWSSNYLKFRDGYYIGGEKFINPNPQSSPNFPKGVSFHVTYPQKTYTDDVIKLDAVLTFRKPSQYRSWHSNASFRLSPPSQSKTQTALQQFSLRNGLTFYLYGFWSQATGKLCMVGSGTDYSKEGNFTQLYSVLKLNYPRNSTIGTSLVSGTLESVNKTDSLSYFEPISMLAFAQLNYNYTLILNESKYGFSSWGDGTEGLPISSALSRSFNREICTVLQSATMGFELEYQSGCNEAENCSPVDGGNGFLPTSMSFSRIQCSRNQSLRMLIGFYNSSFTVYDQPLVPDRMLVGEGAWDVESNRLHLVVCRMLNTTGSLNDSSVGDCTIRFSLWFPANLSLRIRSTAAGQIWSNRTIGDSGYFNRIRFRSMGIRKRKVPGLKYEYTETEKVTKACVPKKISRNERKRYPDANSYDLKFDMRVGKGEQGWGSGSPLTVGEEFYDKSGYLIGSMSWDSLDKVSVNPSILLNISYFFSFTPPTGTKLAGQISYPGILQSRDNLVDIAAEGIYNTGTGGVCMTGCRFLGSHYRKAIKKNSTDCEILINIQFPEINAKHKNYVRGSIKSTRGTSDPLYFDQLDFTSLSLSRKAVVESVSRMDLEIIMVIVANSVVCLFVASQLFYVKRHPDVLPSISFVMLVILTLGHLIPLVLNFEAMFLTNRNRQNVLVGSGGWLEVNEVIVRVITMIAFLLQSYLLQLTWSSRLGDGKQTALWLAEKKALYVFLPLCLVSGFIAWLIHWLSNPYKTPGDAREYIVILKYQGQSIWGDLRSYAGLLLDSFLLPQILLNVFLSSKDKALSPVFYFGTTALRLLPHAYDLYRAHRFAPSSYEHHTIYANRRGDVFSTAWDIIIPCGGLLLAMVIYFQQRFGGSCVLPPKFRASVEYEKVPVVSATVTGD